MHQRDLLGYALESLYEYPKLKKFLTKENLPKEFKLDRLNQISKFYQEIRFTSGVMFLFMIILDIYGVVSILVGINILHSKLNPYISLYLIVLSTMIFCSTILLRVITGHSLKKLSNNLEENFEITEIETYANDYPKDNDIHFNMTDTDFRRIRQHDIKAVVKLNSFVLDRQYPGNGIIAKIVSKQTQRKMYLQIKVTR